jgi:rubrerythrin
VAAAHDIAIAREALRLEREAAARYVEHPAASADPRLVTYWESLRRNEAQHRDLLEAWLRRHGADPGEDAPPRADLTAAALDPDAAGRHPLKLADGARGRAGDLAALLSDYESEDEAVVIYGHFAYQAGERELMELFKELARSESGHRNGLRRVIRSLQEAATPVVLFCPLCGWEIDFGPVPAEGAEVKCRMCPGRFRLGLDERGDWALERLAP